MTDDPSPINERIWTRLMRASRNNLAAVEVRLKAAGLPPLSWYDVLIELKRGPRTGLRPFDLSERLLLAQYNMSRLLARLDSEGLIGITACPDDRRGRIIQITPAGRRLCKRVWRIYGPAIDNIMVGRLSMNEKQQLAMLLHKLV